MNPLISTLLKKRAITEDNVITASYTVRDTVGRMYSKIGSFGIVSFEFAENHINFVMQNLVEKNRVKLTDDSILAIDGMELDRYADVYDLNADGTSKKIGKKRGRKPKNP